MPSTLPFVTRAQLIALIRLAALRRRRARLRRLLRHAVGDDADSLAGGLAGVELELVAIADVLPLGRG